MFNSDGDIAARMALAKEKAEKIASGRYETYDECIMVLRWAIADYRDMPLWDSYFDKLTLEQLVFEYEIIKVSNQTPEEKAEELAVNHQDEMQGLFDDFAEADARPPAQVAKEWVDSTPKGELMSNAEIQSEADKRFMQTGQFKEPE